MGNFPYTLRTFKKGDETELSKLSNTTHERYFGFVPKTPDDWMASAINRPGASPSGVLIVEDDDKHKLAYAVVDNTGKVLEMAVTKTANRNSVAEFLIEHVEQYAEQHGAHRVSIPLPPDQISMGSIFRSKGYGNFYGYHMGMILDYPNFLSKILESNRSKVEAPIEGAFLLLLDKGKKRFRSPNPITNLYIEIAGDSLKIENTVKPQINRSTTTIKLNLFLFNDIVLGKHNVFTLFFKRKVKVKPVYGYIKAIKLLNLLSMDENWFIPFGDVR